MSNLEEEVTEAIQNEEKANYRSYKNWRTFLSLIGAVIAVAGVVVMIAAYVNYENIDALRVHVEETYQNDTFRGADFEDTAPVDWHSYLLVVIITCSVIPIVGPALGIAWGVGIEQRARENCKAVGKQFGTDQGKKAMVPYGIVTALALVGAIMCGVLAIHITIMHAGDTYMDADYHFLLVMIGSWITIGGHLILAGLYLFLTISAQDVCKVETGGVRGAYRKMRERVGRAGQAIRQAPGKVRRSVGFSQYPQQRQYSSMYY